ncbi:hypothetical protein Dimus_023298 [Dionaea muscipula]
MMLCKSAYARKLKLENSQQLSMFDDLADSFTDLVTRPAYQEALFQTGGPVDEEVLRQFEKEVKEKVKATRLMIVEAKESYDNQLKIQKLYLPFMSCWLRRGRMVHMQA